MTQTIPRVVADLELSLAAAVAAGSTTATLSSAVDGDGVSLPAGKYAFTVDFGTADKEYIFCDLSSTALTNIVSLSKQGAATVGFTNYHRRGAVVTITDWAILDRIVDVLVGNTGFDSGTNLGYDGAPAGLTGNQFATVNYVLSVVSGGTVTFDQQVLANQTLGETISVNDVVYFKESDQRWWKADADLSATFSEVVLGISKTAGAAGASATISISGPVSGFVGLSAGSKYYLSNTAGSIGTSAGTTSVFIGWALSTTSLLLAPLWKTSPTQKEKDAMVGSTGTPSSTNKFLTQRINPSNTDQTQTTQDSSSAVGQTDSTGNRVRLAQSFVPTEVSLRGIELYKSADTGSFSGTVTVAIQADSGGSPDGVNLASSTTTNAAWLLFPTGAFQVPFSSDLTVTPSSTYWIVITTSTSDSSNRPNIGINTAGGYASGSAKYFNTTDGWVAISTIDLYFKTLSGFENKIATLASGTGVVPAAGVNYGLVDLSVTSVATSGTSETTVYTKVVPAGIFKLNSGIQLRGAITGVRDTTSGGGQPIVRIKLNGTTISTLDTIQRDVGGTMNMMWEAIIINNNSLSSQNFASSLVGASNGGVTATPALIGEVAVAGVNEMGTASIDTSGGCILTITLQQPVGGTSTHKWTSFEKIG